MTNPQSTPEAVVWVAIDVAKDRHEALIEAPGWKSRKKFRVQKTQPRSFGPLQSFCTVWPCPFGLVLKRRATTIGRLTISSTPRGFISSSFLPLL